MSGPRPRWHEVVRAHHRDTEGLVVAQSGRCLELQADERDLVPGRRFQPLRPADLARRAFPRSWFMGVLLCPGDATDALAAWARDLPPADVDRVHFYYVRGVDLQATLAGWRAAGLPEPALNEVRDFRSLHHLFGRHHGDRVYRDHAR